MVRTWLGCLLVVFREVNILGLYSLHNIEVRMSTVRMGSEVSRVLDLFDLLNRGVIAWGLFIVSELP